IIIAPLQAAEKPLQAVIPSPFAVILSPQSREKDLRSWLRVNSARNLAPSILNAVQDSSSSRVRGTPRNDRPNRFFRSLFSPNDDGRAASERLLLTASRFWCVCPGSP